MVDVIRDVVVVSRCEDIIMVLDPKFWSEFEAQEEEWIFDTAYINEDCIQHIFPTFQFDMFKHRFDGIFTEYWTCKQEYLIYPVPHKSGMGEIYDSPY